MKLSQQEVLESLQLRWPKKIHFYTRNEDYYEWFDYYSVNTVDEIPDTLRFRSNEIIYFTRFDNNSFKTVFYSKNPACPNGELDTGAHPEIYFVNREYADQFEKFVNGRERI